MGQNVYTMKVPGNRQRRGRYTANGRTSIDDVRTIETYGGALDADNNATNIS